MDSRSACQRYWEFENEPSYLVPKERSEWLYNFIKKEIPKDTHIIELGCNCQRNLDYLYKKGYKKLGGVEISKHAIKNGKDYYDVKWDIYEGTIEEHIKKLSPDCYLTMAVLEHMHPKSNWIFKYMAKAKYVITIEDEVHNTTRHCARDYKKIFEDLGMTEVKSYHFSDAKILDPSFFARIFKNENTIS